MDTITKGDKAALLKRLADLNDDNGDARYDTEDAHYQADLALVDFIGDADIKAAYDAIGKWYA